MEYWCDHRLVVGIREADNHREILIDRPFALVGSHPQANVRLSSNHSPKRAMYLHALNGTVLCRQLEVSERQPHLPAEGGILQVAAEKLRVRLEVKAGGRVAAQDNALWPVPVLEVRGKKSQPVARRMSIPLQLIGRHSECDLELRCRQVSLFHCVLYAQRGRLWCIDLQSGNGTILAGQAISCQEVFLGDELAIGTFRIKFPRYSKTRMPSGGSKPDLVGAAWQLLPNAALERGLGSGENTSSDRRTRSIPPSDIPQETHGEWAVQEGRHEPPTTKEISPQLRYIHEMACLTQERKRALESLDVIAQTLTTERESLRNKAYVPEANRRDFEDVVEQTAAEHANLREVVSGQPCQLAAIQQRITEPSERSAEATFCESKSILVSQADDPLSVLESLLIANDGPGGNALELKTQETSAQSFVSETQLQVVADSPRKPRPKSAGGKDPLMHFVSDRLAEIDMVRKRRVAFIWGAALALLISLCVLIVGLTYWMLGA
jgi:hypothetical protein